MVGKSYAEIGFKFYFKEPRVDICPTSCRYYNPCMMNLEKEVIYEIIGDLNISHNCPSDYHDEPMELVKVVPMELKVLIETKQAYLGAVMTYEPLECENIDCPYKIYCSPLIGIESQTKIKILEIVQKIKDTSCNDRNLSLVIVEKA